MQSIVSFQGLCNFLTYMPRKPHKWGVILYQLCVKLHLSGKQFSMDFEPSLAHDLSSNSTRVGPLVACFRLINRISEKAWCSLHIAMDSAFSREATFTWLQSKAAFVTCAIASSTYRQTGMLTLGLEDNHWREVYSFLFCVVFCCSILLHLCFPLWAMLLSNIFFSSMLFFM